MKLTSKNKFLLFFLVLHSLTAFSQSSTNMKDLGISEFKSNEANYQVIYLSGDGGMNTFSVDLCKQFQKKGYSVIAINSKKYFWSAKDPKQLGTMITAVIGRYNKLWGKRPFIIMGYSFGADVASFIPANISAETLENIKDLILLQPSSSTDFEIKLADLYGSSANRINRKYNILKELNRLSTPKTLCLFSVEEKDPLKEELKNAHLSVEVLPGDHRFNYDYPLLIDRITKFIAK